MTKSREYLKKMMPDAFPIFFNRRNPYKGQALVMPDIVKGQNVLFAAPTASGKTEAAISPLYQRHVSFRRTELSTVYIAPTKALVNDLYERLMKYLGSHAPDSIARYTGDHHEYSKKDGVFCLISTPEGLDSLQLRRPHLLETVRAVVVDEIHLLHGQARGQQLRHVIDRIRTSVIPPKSPKDNFQVVGMTATIAEMDKVAKIWLGENEKHFSEGTPRDIDLQLIDVHIDEVQVSDDIISEKFVNWLTNSNVQKVLLFANSRDNAHKIAANLHVRLQNTRWPVHLHFGAITKSVREDVEEKMKNEKFGVCVATSTLEIGIDIGDIDVIVFIDKPFSVSSFLQRIGRGNRRTDTCKVIGFRINEYDEKYYNALLSCGKNGELDDVHEYDRPSVRFQQIMSLVWRSIRNDRSITARKLEVEAGTNGHEPVIQDMLETECLKENQQALILSDKLMDECDAGRMHTVISGGSSDPVIDLKTGKPALKETEVSATVPTVFHAGELRQMKLAPDGTQFLGENAIQSTQLVNFLKTESRPNLSQCIIWALARQEKIDPEIWLSYENTLVTWGGKTLNVLLAEIFNQNSDGEKFNFNEVAIRGDFLEFSPSINDIETMAKQIEETRSLPLETASKFMGKSRYNRELSGDMLAEEKRRSIPWANFYTWLNKIKRIEKVNELADGILNLIK